MGLGNIEIFGDYTFDESQRKRYSYGFRLASSGLVELLHKGETRLNFTAPLNRRVAFEVSTTTPSRFKAHHTTFLFHSQKALGRLSISGWGVSYDCIT